MPDIPGSMPSPKDRPRQRPARGWVGPVLPSKKAQWNMRNPPPSGFASWWPVGVGIVLAFFAPRLRDLLAPYDPWGMRAVFPFVQFFGLREIGMGDQLTRGLPQLMLYLQFPLEGLLTKLTLGRGVTLVGAVMQLLFLHFAAGLVLWLVAIGNAG